MLPALLALTALVGYLLMAAPTRRHPGASTDRPSAAAAPLSGQVRAGAQEPRTTTSLPLRVEDAPTTIDGRARPAVLHQAGKASGHQAGKASGHRPARAAAHRRHAPRMPSASRRDADLASWLAAHDMSSSTYDSAGRTYAEVGGTTDPAAEPRGDSTSGPADQAGSSGPAATADFGLSSFNVLGASHTRHGARGRASGIVRIHRAARLLARHDVDVVGFQELQQEQARELLRVTGGRYALYPGPGRGRDSENSVGWRTSEWQLVRPTTISVPYFNGHHRAMPVVLLRNRATGVEAWFASFHNPADTSRYHHQQHWRDLATGAEVEMANRIVGGGAPLFVTGDMNERATYFCRFTGRTRMHAARPGSTNGAGGCQAGRPRAVDWIFGSPGAVFSGYDEDRSHLVDITTDHPVISTRVRLTSNR
jgi:endonuclease/exonuclease/phosphatase family metal-dependent hydrolase